MNLRVAVCLSTLLLALAVSPSSAVDLESHFDADAESWGTTDPAATLAWQSTGGLPDGCLQGTTTGGVWRFSSPAAWSGDWSAYRTVKFDISIPSRHYPDNDSAGMLQIVGGGAQTMTWTGPTPLWNWTHYEISLHPDSFDVDPTTFSNILASVSHLNILAEFTTAQETVQLDNVIVTEQAANLQEDDLVSTFTTGTIEDWRPVDDVTLTAEAFGYPSMGLKANDWMDGRTYRIASPLDWAGDWSNLVQLSFDMHWSGSFSTPRPLVHIFGANGDVLTYSELPVDDTWIRPVIPLTPATFGVDQARFDAVMAYVTHIWITGEFGGSDDITYFDNIRVTANPSGPKVFETSLLSRFGTDEEGWGVFDNGILTWDGTAGFTGGAIKAADAGSGVQKFQSPDAWSGDWRSFAALRFMLKTFGANRAGLDLEIWIVTWDGTSLYFSPPRPWRSWTPYTIDLTPATFGVTQGEFDAVMADVAYLWIRADLVSGTGSTDTTGLDEVALVSSADVAQPPPDKLSTYDADTEDWRNGYWTGSTWYFRTTPPTHYAAGGNPDGMIANTDVGTTAFWYSPENWAGDWRGYQSVSFDETILSGSSVLPDTWGLSIASPWGNLDADVIPTPVNGSWTHYEIALTPGAFGVTQAEFDTIMRDVVALCIRSEWIDGSEEEGLDNVRLTKTSDAYWAWIATHITNPTDLANELISGKFADPDDDGDDNWTEFIAQTIPVDQGSYFHADLPQSSPGGYTILFTTHTGRLYQVERCTSLEPPSWAPLGAVATGDGSIHMREDAAGDSGAFYRLNVWMAP